MAMAKLVYRTGLNCLPGSNDRGTVSAWYVFAALGLYPRTPSSVELHVSSPMFPKALLAQRHLTILAPGALDVYVDNVKWNGRRQLQPWLPEQFVQPSLHHNPTERGLAPLVDFRLRQHVHDCRQRDVVSRVAKVSMHAVRGPAGLLSQLRDLSLNFRRWQMSRLLDLSGTVVGVDLEMNWSAVVIVVDHQPPPLFSPAQS